jgi:hypothetical protein
MLSVEEEQRKEDEQKIFHAKPCKVTSQLAFVYFSILKEYNTLILYLSLFCLLKEIKYDAEPIELEPFELETNKRGEVKQLKFKQTIKKEEEKEQKLKEFKVIINNYLHIFFSFK